MYKIKIVEGNIADGLEEKVNAEIEKKNLRYGRHL